MDWRQLSVDTDAIAADAVAELLVDCGAGGVAIEDPGMIKERIREDTWDAYEFPEELVNRDFVRVKAYFPCDSHLAERADELKRRLDKLNVVYLPGSIKNVSWADIREEDWANSWKAYYKPVKAGEKVVIKPTWEDYNPSPGEIIIELDPGMAFGTGTHPTTVMCVRLLEKIVKGGETIFDIGTGSGILAITAAKLGAGSILAVDMDEVAVTAARANVEANSVGGQITVTAGNLLDGLVGKADIIIANIVADVIIRLCPDAFQAVKPGGKFVTSGVIAPRADDVRQALESAGFSVQEVVCEGDWVSFLTARED